MSRKLAILLGTIVVIHCTLVLSDDVEIHWRAKTFQSHSNKVILVKLGDNLKIICPHGNNGEYENMWMVDYRHYTTCNATCARYSPVVLCDTPQTITVKTLHICDRNTWTFGNVGFVPGSMHYFIGTSRGTRASVKLRTGGRCKTHDMKFAVFVCDSPKDITCDECSLPLGLEDGRITFHQIIASSESDSGHARSHANGHTSSHARLLSSTKCFSQLSAWCVSKSLDMKHYIQFDLKHMHLLSGIVTQGSPNSPSWITRYKLTYSLDGKDWIPYKTIQGNTNQNSTVRHWFKPRFHARIIRVTPVAWNEAICLRVELYGCAIERSSTSDLPSKFVAQPNFQMKQDLHRILCGSMKCHPYALCTVNSGKAQCSCARKCKKGGKICGSDGKLYNNVCTMKKNACEKNRIIRQVKTTKCVNKNKKTIVTSKQEKSTSYYYNLGFACLLAVSLIATSTFVVVLRGWVVSPKKKG